MTARAVLVAGAGGAIGFEIVKRFCARGAEVIATYRTPRDGLESRLHALGAEPVQWDMQDRERGRALLAKVDAAAFTPILTISGGVSAMAPEHTRLVFFSSNNVAIDPDAPVYAALHAAEQTVRENAPLATILRPTMIYGYPGDGNLGRLMGAMRRLPVAPMIGVGRALQQPVFFADVAGAVVDLIEAETVRPGPVAIAGPTRLSQAELYRAVRAAGRAHCVIAPVPAALAGAVARLAAALNLPAPLSAAQIARANLDKTPTGAEPIIGATSLETGLRVLAEALDGQVSGA